MKPRLRKDGKWWQCKGSFGLHSVIGEGRTWREAYEHYCAGAMRIINGVRNV